MEVYKSIYKKTLEYAGKLSFSEPVFLCAIGHEADRVDMARWKYFEDRDFVMAAYLQLLQRMPNEKDIEHWLDVRNYKKALIHYIICTKEFMGKNIQVVNCPFPMDSRALRFRKRMACFPQSLHGRYLFRLYKKFPIGIRLKIREMMRV